MVQQPKKLSPAQQRRNDRIAALAEIDRLEKSGTAEAIRTLHAAGFLSLEEKEKYAPVLKARIPDAAADVFHQWRIRGHHGAT